MDNTVYDVTFKKDDDVLYVDTRGERTLEVVLLIAKETIEACKKHDAKKALIDVRNLKGRLSTINAFNIPSEYFKDLRNPEIIRKVAIIDNEEFTEQYKFFENVAVNRGYNLRIFSDTAIALAWLKSDI